MPDATSTAVGAPAAGTRVGVSADAPYLEPAYKMVEYDGVFRRPGRADVIGLADERPPRHGVPLPQTVMRDGQRTRPRPTAHIRRAPGGLRCGPRPAPHRGAARTAEDRTGMRRKAMSHTVEWKARLHIFEDDEGTTKAHLVLDTGTTALTGHGAAHCHPADANVPEIGDELAAGRAMNDLARKLLQAAERDIEGTGAPRPGTHQAAGWLL